MLPRTLGTLLLEKHPASVTQPDRQARRLDSSERLRRRWPGPPRDSPRPDCKGRHAALRASPGPRIRRQLRRAPALVRTLNRRSFLVATSIPTARNSRDRGIQDARRYRASSEAPARLLLSWFGYRRRVLRRRC